MKLQYLGDSKDSFKWDYHDYLTSELGYKTLTVAPMLTPDDGGGDGMTNADLFPARSQVLRFCNDLRAARNIETITTLPSYTGASYQLSLHRGSARCADRALYFSGFREGNDQLVFVDPDNGFEPDKSCTDQHVRYPDVSQVLEQVSGNSIVSVFQNFRRISFPQDFAKIRTRLADWQSTAIYWHSLMFVAVAKEQGTIERVVEANRKYSRTYPVTALQ